MKKTVILFALAVGFGQAAGDNARTARRASPAIPAKSNAVDLDLTLDFAEDETARPVTRAARTTPGAYAWMYWAMGATVAAGGLGWYIHEQDAKTPGVTRSEQVFTDDR